MTVTKGFYTEWSEEDQQYAGLCIEYPSLSWLADSQCDAIAGIIQLVREQDEPSSLNIPADILHEIIDGKIEESNRQLKEEMRMIAYDMTMKALYNSRPQAQQPPQGQEALFLEAGQRHLRRRSSRLSQEAMELHCRLGKQTGCDRWQ
jgi:hypothetical protein